MSVKISWDSIPSAIGYNVYRTPNPNDKLENLELLAIVNETSFLDNGAAVLEGKPLQSGSLGKWHKLNIPQLNIPRESFASIVVPKINSSSEFFILAVGGRNGSEILGSYEYATVNVTSSSSLKDREMQTLSDWILVNGVPPRADFSAILLTDVDNGGSGLVLQPGERSIIFSSGTTTGETNSPLPWSTQLILNDISNLQFNSFTSSPGVSAGSCFQTYPGHLGVYGGGNSKSGIIETLTSVKNWNSGINMVYDRVNQGCVKESRFIFMIGGELYGSTTILSSTESTFT